MDNQNKLTHIKINEFVFEVTDACNFLCPYCLNPSRTNAFMEVQSFKKIANILKQKGCDKVVLSGGEPLLHPHIKDMLIYLNERNFAVTLATNCSLIDEDWIHFLVKCDNITLQISMDVIDENIHDTLRCKGSFKKNIDTINKLVELGYEKGSIRMTINKQNYLQTRKMYDFALEKRFRPIFSFVTKKGRANLNWDNLALDIDDYESVLKMFNKKGDTRPGIHSVLMDLKEGNGLCHILMDVPVLTPFLTVDFNVRPCGILDYILGNLVTDDFDEIFGIKLQNLCEFMELERKRIINAVCRKCIGKINCMVGCIPMMSDLLTKTDNCIRIENSVRKSISKIMGEIYK